ncbi:MAG: hypothetical protein LAT67_05685 [Balneolales bacterium]|nr:hypothetical protein [Balneolales bacterium]
MLRSLYEQIGFFPTLFLSISLFIAVIFWAAGIAGIIAGRDLKKPASNFTIALCIFVPVYPIIWLIFDMIRQYTRITNESLK